MWSISHDGVALFNKFVFTITRRINHFSVRFYSVCLEFCNICIIGVFNCLWKLHTRARSEVTLANRGRLWARACGGERIALSHRCVTPPTEVTWIAVWKEAVSWSHVPQEETHGDLHPPWLVTAVWWERWDFIVTKLGRKLWKSLKRKGLVFGGLSAQSLFSACKA